MLMTKKKYRVLVLADDCNPDWPSLPVVGYQAARALADVADVTLATHVRNRREIERDGCGRATVVYLDNEYIARPMFKLGKLIRGGHSVGWTTNIAMTYPSYLAFEYEAYKRFKKDFKQRRFDIIHRITPMSPTIPSPLAKWSKIPFVLGPLNGGLPWPPGFDGERAREREWLVRFRSAYRALPYYRSTYRRSAAVLAAFAHTAADLPAAAQPHTLDFPEVGLNPDLFWQAEKPHRPSETPLTFLFVGRLVPYKCPDIVLRAFAASPALRHHRLLIVGDGPERASMEQFIADQNLAPCVQMLGWKTQKEVGELMRQSDVFAFPSIRELGAGVVVEAMACGLCCLVVDYGGPGGLIAPDRGIKVPLGTREALTTAFTAEMQTLAAAPQKASALGQAARDYALRELSWHAKAQKTLEVYKWVLGHRATPPNFYQAAGVPSEQLQPPATSSGIR
jgi:glycosyltransferase involved in cell wall biosynthesis